MNKSLKIKQEFLEALRERNKEYGRGFQTFIATDIGKTKGAFTSIFKYFKNEIELEKVKLSFDLQVEIAEACGTDYIAFIQKGRDLIEGKPTPLIVQTNSDEEKDLLTPKAPDYRGVPLMESGKLAAWSNESSFDEYERPSCEVIVYLPELGHRANHNLVAARVGGDSMEPIIPKDAIIIIDKDDREFVDDKIFAVAIEDAGVQNLAVKYVRKFEVAKGFSLWSENRQYQPRLVTESDWLRLCVGRVIWMWRSFNG